MSQPDTQQQSQWQQWASVALFTVAFCFMVTLFAMKMVQEPSSRPMLPCRKNLKQIGIALHNYHYDYGSFPPAYIADEQGRPMHSWRVLILPYLGEEELYDQYDFSEPWDGPNNRRLHDRMPRILIEDGMFYDTYCGRFQCPDREDRSESNQTTSYVAVVGPGTAFPGSETVTEQHFTDGVSFAVQVVEIDNSDIHWMEPRDLLFEEMEMQVNPSKGPGISSQHSEGAFALFADSHIEYIWSKETSPERLRHLLLISDGGPSPDEDF